MAMEVDELATIEACFLGNNGERVLLGVTASIE